MPLVNPINLSDPPQASVENVGSGVTGGRAGKDYGGSSVRPGQDCYFYYYSSCSRGSSCPFRHEPAALTNETVCTYWKQGNCNKPHCIFRHLEVGNKKRNITACYWETQPSGCSKPHCPFLHQLPKDPVSQALPMHPHPAHTEVHHPKVAPPSAKVVQVGTDSGSIIVNPAKLSSIQQILTKDKVIHNESLAAGQGAAKRLVVAPGATHIARKLVTGGVKARLGGGGIEKIKARLGDRKVPDDGLSSGEEEMLRASAMKTLDLRGRLLKEPVRRVVQQSDTESEDERERDRLALKRLRRKQRKIKERLAEKSEKRKKSKKKRLKSKIVSDRIDPSEDPYLPSASDYSDLDSPASPDPAVISVMSKTDKAGSLRSDLMLSKGNRIQSAKERLGGRNPYSDDEEDRMERERMRLERKVGDRERSSYAAKILGDLKRSRETGFGANIVKEKKKKLYKSDDEIKLLKKPLKRKSLKDSSPKPKKVKKSKESKLSKLIESSKKRKITEITSNDDYIQDLSDENENVTTVGPSPVKRKVKVNSKGNSSLDTSKDVSVGDVMKELDDFINE